MKKWFWCMLLLLCVACSWTALGEGEACKHVWDWGNLVDNGAGMHGIRCQTCGEFNPERLEYHKGGCMTGECVLCQAKLDEHSTILHCLLYVTDLGDGTHRWYCRPCGYKVYEIHTRSCTQEGTACETCGGDCSDACIVHADAIAVPTDAQTHVWQCRACGKAASGQEMHSRYCTEADGVCSACGQAASNLLIRHHNGLPVDAGDGMHVQICTDCGEKTYTEHDWEKAHYADLGDGTHALLCTQCGSPNPEREGHYHLCTEHPSICEKCWERVADLETYHTNAQCLRLTEELHWTRCLDCGVPLPDMIVEHVWINGVDGWDGTHTLTCEGCGATKTERHNWDWGVVVKAATDTEDGARLFKCASCTATRREAIPALGEKAPESPVASPVAEAQQVFLTDIVCEGGMFRATVVLDEVTKALDARFLRVEYQLANGETRVEVIELDETMKFALDIGTDVVHILIELTDTADVLEPGDWTVYGRYEMDVK